MKRLHGALAMMLLPAAVCAGQSTAPVKHVCTIDKAPAGEAEKALAAENYAKALELFAAMAHDSSTSKGDPTASAAGTIRTLIAEEHVAEALKQATDWVASEPSNGAAHEMLAEVYYRRGEFPPMSQEMLAAQKLDPCNPRLLLSIARFQRLQGNFETAKKKLDTAHQLAPNDPEISNQWIRSSILVSDERPKAECEPAAPISTAEVPLKEIMDGVTRRSGIALDVLFNGKRRRLEVDTGASGLLLSRSAASGLGLVSEVHGKVDGVGDNGLALLSSAHVDSIRIGGMEFRNCPVQFLEQRGRLDIDGLIGGDFFREYVLTLNFPDLKMSLDPLPKVPEAKPDAPTALSDRYIAPEMKDWTHIYSVGHELLVPVGLMNKKRGFKDKLFLIDSGAGLMSISPEAAREITKVYGDDSMEVSGIAGKVEKTFSTSDFDLIFGHLRLPVYEMTSFDTSRLSQGAGVEVSGFLGAPVLDRLTLRIDYRDRLVKFDYDVKKDPINRAQPQY